MTLGTDDLGSSSSQDNEDLGFRQDLGGLKTKDNGHGDILEARVDSRWTESTMASTPSALLLLHKSLELEESSRDREGYAKPEFKFLSPVNLGCRQKGRPIREERRILIFFACSGATVSQAVHSGYFYDFKSLLRTGLRSLSSLF